MTAVKNYRCPAKDFKSLIDYGLYVDGEDDSGQSVLTYVLAQYYPTETHKREMISIALNAISDLDQIHKSLLYLASVHDSSDAASYMTVILDHILRLPIAASTSDRAGARGGDDAGAGPSGRRQEM
jgi:hypothetical protein